MSTPPPPPAVPGRAEILAILASFGDRPPEEVPESVDSMELAWLVHQLEQRYGGTVPDASLVRMTTVSAVLDELAALSAHAEPPAPTPVSPAATAPGLPGTGVRSAASATGYSDAGVTSAPPAAGSTTSDPTSGLPTTGVNGAASATGDTDAGVTPGG
ncbi:MAG: hypothetical protein HOY69_22500, partial [Streptomyces sp.]|nr:hypothetical protein [Streptomyces sp.]